MIGDVCTVEGAMCLTLRVTHTQKKNTVYLVQGESQGEWHIILAKYKGFNLKVHHKQ